MIQKAADFKHFLEQKNLESLSVLLNRITEEKGRGSLFFSYGSDRGCMTLITLSVWQSSGTSILSA